jgi:choloylglycine hydrolase
MRPFGVGSGMHGLPGDFTPPSRFIRAVAYTQTMFPFPDAHTGVREATRIMHNFDIPRGLVLERPSTSDPIAGYTQWTVIGDIRHKRYHYWTEFNARMRLVELDKLDFTGNKIAAIPLDEERVEDVKERTQDFSSS